MTKILEFVLRHTRVVAAFFLYGVGAGLAWILPIFFSARWSTFFGFVIGCTLIGQAADIALKQRARDTFETKEK